MQSNNDGGVCRQTNRLVHTPRLITRSQNSDYWSLNWTIIVFYHNIVIIAVEADGDTKINFVGEFFIGFSFKYIFFSSGAKVLMFWQVNMVKWIPCQVKQIPCPVNWIPCPVKWIPCLVKWIPYLVNWIPYLVNWIPCQVNWIPCLVNCVSVQLKGSLRSLTFISLNCPWLERIWTSILFI